MIGRKVLQISLLAVILATVPFPPLVAITEADPGSPYADHEPIFIDGNNDFTVANGVTLGNGTPSDPYVIEGWEINASRAHGIEIRNTTAAFVIRDVFAHSGKFIHDGISLRNVTNGRVENATLLDTTNGVFCESSSNISVKNSDALGDVFGVGLQSCSRITIEGNNVSDNLVGIHIRSSNDVTVTGNKVSSNNGYGSILLSSANVTITENTVTSNRRGILLDSSVRVTIAGNMFAEDGIFFDGPSIAHYNTHTIPPDNFVNGKPLYYYKDCDGVDVAGIAVGELIVANCTDFEATDLEISNADVGIQLAFVEGARITRNNVSSNGLFGVYLYASSNATIEANHLSANTRASVYLHTSTNVIVARNSIISSQEGIFISSSTNVTMAGNTVRNSGDGISAFRSRNVLVEDSLLTDNGGGIQLLFVTNATMIGNHISNNGRGIDAGYSTETTVAHNRISSNLVDGVLFVNANNVSVKANRISTNGHGIRFADSLGMLVHHNNMIENGVQAFDERGIENTWDDGYPSGGNYWSDYAAPDRCSGPSQRICTRPDGLGDVPYDIAGGGQDRYPLAQPFNEAPVASFVLSPSAGNVTTAFLVDASSSSDSEDPTVALEVRWDWENDGVWDTPWSTEKISQHRYARSGIYTIRLEVRDTGGLTNITTREIVVGPGSDGVPSNFDPAFMVLILLATVAGAVLLYMIRRRRKPVTSGTPQKETRELDHGDD